MKSLTIGIIVAAAMCAPAAAQYSSEAGFAILQQNCMTCDGQAKARDYVLAITLFANLVVAG
jgi:hypothetical protein